MVGGGFGLRRCGGGGGGVEYTVAVMLFIAAEMNAELIRIYLQ